MCAYDCVQLQYTIYSTEQFWQTSIQTIITAQTLSIRGKDDDSHSSTSTCSYTPPLSSLEEHVEADSGFPLFFDAVFTDFTLTVDNTVSPEGTTHSEARV